MKRGPVLLICEDEKGVAIAIRDSLLQLGYRVAAVVSDGETAVEQARALRPDLVLMDIQLQGAVDGVQAARRIKDELHVPVVYLTAYSDADTLERAGGSDPLGYVLKPFGERELNTAIQTALYRHQMEERLRTSEHWLAATLNSVGDGVLAADESGRVAFINPAARRLLGIPLAAVENRPIEDVYRATPAEADGGRPVEATLAGPDDESIPIEQTVAPIRDEAGRELGTLTVFRDIRSRKESENELQMAFSALEGANAALRRASEAKSDFLSHMSHELRTPLNAILGFSEMMLGMAPSEMSAPETTVYLKHIYESGRHLLDLINEVLDLARIESGHLELEPANVDVGETMAGAASALAPLAERKSIHVQVARPAVGTVWADPRRLRQVLFNLLSNAIKFTPDGGRVTMEAVGDAREVRIRVSDTGIGIAPEDRERIFEVFEQVNPTSSGESGSGLGLAITRQVVRAHDGRLELESELGRGSRFTVVMPRTGADLREPASPVARLPGKAASLLLIEDNVASALRLRHFLSQAGYSVRWMADGEKALQALTTWTPAAIILDLELPGLDSWDVLRRLKAQPQSRNVPVIVAAGRDEGEVGLALGAIDYLVKPLDGPTLLEGLGRLTYTRKVRSSSVRILAVDDDAAALDLYRGVLEPEGFRVLRASGGREGLQKARRDRPDLILLDLIMPDLDGFQVVSRLRGDPRTADIPVLVVTAHQLTEADKKRLNGDIMGVLAKGDDGLAGLQRWLTSVVPAGAPV